ncbi:MAG: glycosyltransferase family 4 protein [Kiritimatiellae bacterium]|nr:glycosyltransferase family 4 protein [Kiritimatiellia bacterium]
MRVGVNTLFYLPGEVGGSETYLLEILRQWKRAAVPEEVVLFTQIENHEKLSAEFDGEGWSCVLSPFRAVNRFARIAREQVELPYRVRRAKLDVLWSPGYTAPVLGGCPQVVSLLDMQYKRFPQDLTGLARLTTHILVQASALDRRKQVLTISEFSKQDILRFTSAHAERIHVTPLAADANFRPPVSATEPPTPYLLCVANSYPHKAVDKLVAAFGRLEDRIPHDLVVVGKARLGEAAVQAALRGLKQPGRVKRLAGLNRQQLITLYQSADVFVFPSLYEGFGLPVLEAMQSGVPVLTTRCGSIPEVGGDAVFYADAEDIPAFADSLAQCVAMSKEKRARCIQSGLHRAQAFTWERTAGGTLQVLRKACGLDRSQL